MQPPRSPSNAFIYNVRDTCAPLSAPTNLFPTNCCPPLSLQCLGSRLRTCSWSGNSLDPFFLSLFFSLSPYLSLDPKYTLIFLFSLPLSLFLCSSFHISLSLFFSSWSRIKKKVIDMQGWMEENSIFCLLWGGREVFLRG